MPRIFTVDEVVEIFKTKKTVSCYTAIPAHYDMDGHKQEFDSLAVRHFDNVYGKHEEFRKVLQTATAPIYVLKINKEEFKKWNVGKTKNDINEVLY